MTQQHHYETGIDDYGDVYDIVIRDNGSIIAVLSAGEGPAQHLVRAGNCHDELLHLLKLALVRDQTNQALRDDERATLLAIIAKAEGRGG